MLRLTCLCVREEVGAVLRLTGLCVHEEVGAVLILGNVEEVQTVLQDLRKLCVLQAQHHLHIVQHHLHTVQLYATMCHSQENNKPKYVIHRRTTSQNMSFTGEKQAKIETHLISTSSINHFCYQVIYWLQLQLGDI